MIKVIFLGTNGWYTTETGDTTCILIETEHSYIVLDAGNGLYKLDRYATNKDKPIYMFLSHFHIDHISGLHILDKFNFTQGIKIYCYKGGKVLLESIIKQPYTIEFSGLKYNVEIKEIEQGEVNDLPFNLKCLELVHSAKCLGYRFDIGGKIISYCTDTGYCQSALDLAEGADLIIAECALLKGESVTDWPHLNPENAARIAKESNAKRLSLIHFDAKKYDNIKKRKEAQLCASKIFNNTAAAEDEMVITL